MVNEYQKVEDHELQVGDEFYLSYGEVDNRSIWGRYHDIRELTYVVTEFLQKGNDRFRVMMKTPEWRQKNAESFPFTLVEGSPLIIMAKKTYKAYDPEQVGDRDDDL